ncbi:MAG TPA: hypothetical protein VJG83_02400 [archaeon]|nr:hypothetical protein [archaeon]
MAPPGKPGTKRIVHKSTSVDRIHSSRRFWREHDIHLTTTDPWAFSYPKIIETKNKELKGFRLIGIMNNRTTGNQTYFHVSNKYPRPETLRKQVKRLKP